MLLKENKFISDNTVACNSIIENQESLLSTLKGRSDEEMTNLEFLQTKFYGETVKMANFCEDIDKIIDFLEEFTNVAAKEKITKATLNKLSTFRKLSSEDKDNIFA